MSDIPSLFFQVYSPTPDDMLSQGGDPNLQYASPKGGISSGDSYYIGKWSFVYTELLLQLFLPVPDLIKKL